ncbi:MAG: oxidoreductase [Bacteroidota bacterium]
MLINKEIKTIFILWICFLFVACNDDNSQSIPELDHIKIFPVESSVRALEVQYATDRYDSTSKRKIWYAGSNGDFGYSMDNGATWRKGDLKYDTIIPHFRGIAHTAHYNFLMAVDRPALIYSTNSSGDNWSVVYKEDVPGVFYDAIAFWDNSDGIVIGDPIDNCMSVLISRNTGQSWDKVPCNKLGPAHEGEAAFAASNSNIAIYKDHAWFVTGGKKARIFHSSNKGVDWEVFETPIIQGGSMTGIFTVDFWDDKNGIIMGGDWENKENNKGNKAITKDGGKTWELVSDGAGPGYRSCVKYFPDGNGKQLIAVGIPGISISEDGGYHWKKISDESFYTLAFGDSGNEIWLAGDKKIGKMVWVD